MEKENFNFIMRMIYILVISFILIGLFAQIHEVTHVQIGKYYGCENGRIAWDFLDTNKLITETFNGGQPAFMSTNWDSDCNMTDNQILAHSMNEVIGYNIVPLLELIFVAVLMIGYIILRSKNVTIKLHKKKKGNLTQVEINKPL
jgi:disulfide bond formation protein DsbB